MLVSSTVKHFRDPDQTVQDSVREETGDKSISNRIRKRHAHDRYESWEGISDKRPVDGGNLAHHHAADEDERTAGGPRRDGSEYRSKEDGDQEAETGCDGRKASATTFRNTGAGFDERGDGGAAEQGANGDGDGVGAVCECGAGEVACFWVDDSRETRHRVEGCGGVDDVDVQEGEEGEGEVGAGGTKIPVLCYQDAADGSKVDDLLEKGEHFIALGGVREVGKGSIATVDC